MLRALIRTVLLIVIVVAIVVGAGAFFLGFRFGGRGTTAPAGVATSGRADTSETARERGAEIGEKVGAAVSRAADALSDGQITAKIKSKMALDDTIKSREIHVSTSNAVVTLSGKVASASERDRALQLARETDGVKSVTDQLQIVAAK